MLKDDQWSATRRAYMTTLRDRLETHRLRSIDRIGVYALQSVDEAIARMEGRFVAMDDRMARYLKRVSEKERSDG